MTITIIQTFFDIIGGKLGRASLFDFSLLSPLSLMSLLLLVLSCINCVPWLSLVSCPSRRSLYWPLALSVISSDHCWGMDWLLWANFLSSKCWNIWPWQLLKQNTAANRGSPPCTQSQHHINRETYLTLLYLLYLYSAFPASPVNCKTLAIL